MAQSNLGGLKIGAVPDMVYWIGRDEMLPRLLFDNQVKACCRRLRSKYRSSLLPSPVPLCAGVPDSITHWTTQFYLAGFRSVLTTQLLILHRRRVAQAFSPLHKPAREPCSPYLDEGSN